MVTKSKSQTQRIATQLAKKILKAKNLKALPTGRQVKAQVIALQGNLGAGKTAFVQGFCKALGVKHNVTSPTFIIFRKHPIPSQKSKVKSYQSVYHFDLYRIISPKELNILGFKKIIRNPENIVLIEWPERVKKLLPKNTIWINFEHLKKQNQRKIDISK